MPVCHIFVKVSHVLVPTLKIQNSEPFSHSFIELSFIICFLANKIILIISFFSFLYYFYLLMLIFYQLELNFCFQYFQEQSCWLLAFPLLPNWVMLEFSLSNSVFTLRISYEHVFHLNNASWLCLNDHDCFHFGLHTIQKSC